MPAPLTLTAVLNGCRAVGSHPRLPVTTADLVADAVAVRAVGAAAVVVHARDDRGAVTLDPQVVDDVVRHLRRSRPDLAIGVGTDAQADLDSRGRATLVETWTEPDFVAVRLAEASHSDLLYAALGSGMALAVVLSSPGDVQRLNRSGLVDEVSRVFVVPDAALDGPGQVVMAGAIERALAAAGVHAPRVHGGSGAGCWAVLRAAVSRGRDIRVGLADTLVMPDGRLAASNGALVRAARKLLEPANS